MNELVCNDGTWIENGTRQEFTYSGGLILYIDYITSRGTYRQTFTYSGGNISTISIPTKQ